MIPVALITTHGRIRQADPSRVGALVDSIAEVGLLNPITVYRRTITRNGQDAEGYGLIAGAHRLEACKALGLVEIEAQIVDLDEQQRIIAECDENLCGSRLTPSEVALFTSKRKAAYIALHPETAKPGPKDAEKFSTTFADDQAEKTGVTARKVRMDAERGEKVTTAALAMVRGTPLDTGVYLDKLKKVDPDKQCEKVKRDLEAARKPKPKPKTAPHAPDPEDDYSVRERQVAALMNAWNKAGKEAREAFLDRIGQ